MGEVKYINKQMAIDAINGDLPVWAWNDPDKDWYEISLNLLTKPSYATDRTFAIGEKPTSPPRKMIEVDGVRMPAPIINPSQIVGGKFYLLISSLEIREYSESAASVFNLEFIAGNVYATEADAIAARDGWLKVKKQAMERSK